MEIRSQSHVSPHREYKIVGYPDLYQLIMIMYILTLLGIFPDTGDGILNVIQPIRYYPDSLHKGTALLKTCSLKASSRMSKDKPCSVTTCTLGTAKEYVS